ncbi:response regulator transcription factor [Amphritea pacifica]|uniref:Helix-turn-helix transcriptional regulator n=1 Tax=Amphritea pacifica TaxID=2811233 RepID=A0ABS2W7K2_9GAMM|nr:helix-turn-helix transcriptional regulator [Amphritea pacifica]MBN0987561.1 helix-turn-helix transcriptional regulator [Amphritea pacifica]MBN1005116.1 helix-turn-helix transcriptional regulator [Amphritea pacifica]
MSKFHRVAKQPLMLWHDAIAGIITHGVNDEAVDNLMDTLRRVVDADGSTLIVYPEGRQPYCPSRKRRKGEDPRIHIDQYLESAYLLDPFYRLATDGSAEGVYSLADVAPDGFKQSEFYRVYYRLVNFGDEICLIIPTDNASIQVSISRQDNKPKFTAAQQGLIQRVFSTVKAILLKWWGSSQKVQKDHFLDSHLECALSHFGSSVLTQRETQILQLILRGYAVKYIAEKLEISPETIKHHRKNIYAKLDINSQAEMFHLFIDSLRMVTPDSPPDPLTNYLKPPAIR